MTRPSALGPRALEGFFAAVSFPDAGFAVSDGVSVVHVSLDEPTRSCLWGKVHEIRQTLHVFCLDFRPLPASAIEWSWRLHFEPLRRVGSDRDLTAREMANVMLLFATPDEVEWRHTANGRWTAADGFRT